MHALTRSSLTRSRPPRTPFSRPPDRRDLIVVACCAIAAGCLTGGDASIPAALLGALAALYVRHRRTVEREVLAVGRLIAAAPPLVDLFAAALACGLLPADAALTVADAFEDPDPVPAPRRDPNPTPTVVIARRFRAAGTDLRSGVDPEYAWRALLTDEATAAVGAAALRASRTGAPAAAAVAKGAETGRAAARYAGQARVRACAVRATAPLALCFLPGFILLGIVPTAIGLFGTLRP